MIPRLGVNIDHVATLRQQRDEFYPEVARAAEISLSHGAHQITIHLREDRRHIQDKDVPSTQLICRRFNKLLNLEMGCSEEMIKIAIDTKPDWVCLVPEKRAERTTEGGLNLLSDLTFNQIKNACDQIKEQSPKTKISLFVEADLQLLSRCLSLNADAVEIHTGEYARDFIAKHEVKHHLIKYAEGRKIIKAAGWGYHAGHGLTLQSLEVLLNEKQFEEYNIGHWIVAESLFIGMGRVISDMLTLMSRHPLEG